MSGSAQRLADRGTQIAAPADDLSSFEAFFEATHARLFGALCVVTGNRNEAEEIMQDAYLILWERWARVRTLEDPTGFLYRTAMNGFRKRYRRAAMAIRRAMGTAPHDDDFAAVEDREVVIGALRRLIPQQRAAVVLTSLLDYTSEDAGRMLGIKASTVRVLTTRARAVMRRSIGEHR